MAKLLSESYEWVIKLPVVENESGKNKLVWMIKGLLSAVNEYGVYFVGACELVKTFNLGSVTRF